MSVLNRCAVTVVARQPMLDWLRPFASGEERELARSDASVYLLPCYEDEREAWQCLRSVSARIFAAELELWCRDVELWPSDRSFEVFQQWFTPHFHHVVEDLGGEPLRSLAVDPALEAELRQALAGDGGAEPPRPDPLA